MVKKYHLGLMLIMKKVDADELVAEAFLIKKDTFRAGRLLFKVEFLSKFDIDNDELDYARKIMLGYFEQEYPEIDTPFNGCKCLEEWESLDQKYFYK